MTLYDMAAEFRQVLDDLEQQEGAEPTESTLALLAEIEADIKNKADGYCSLIKHYESVSKAINAEVERLQHRQCRNAARAEWLQGRLKLALEAIGEKKIETPLNTIAIVGNGGMKPVTVQCRPEDLPEPYRKTVTTIQPNKDAIRKALEAGQFIPGCLLLERGNRLTIK